MPIAGLLAIGLGIGVFFRPLTSLTTIAIFFGIGILFSGISEIISFCGAGKGNRSGWMLFTGIASVLFGLWAAFGMGMYAIARFIPFIFAGWIFALAIERIADAVARKYIENEDGSTTYKRSVNKWGLFLGILTLLSSIILMFNPLMSARFVSIMLSILLITYGINTIELFFRIRKTEKAEKKAAEKQAADVPKSRWKRMGKKALILFILAWVVKIVIAVVAIIVVAN
jgi:uncharacterized membrane protein HdeD (DUF308 family)